MDGSFISKQQASPKIYKHFTVNSELEKNVVQKDHIEFFYVGKNLLKIDFFIKTFGGGYGAENVQKAISLLSRMADKLTVPDFIIVDKFIDEEALLELIHFVSDSKMYSMVPFVLDGSELSNTDLNTFRSYKFIDEIFFVDKISGEELKSKIGFLKRVKNRDLVYQNGNLSCKPFDNYFETKNLVKRLFDVCFSTLLILLLSPLLLIIAAAIKLESEGPVLYVSKRAGRGCRTFNFYKFRTMVVGADQKIPQLSHLNHYVDHDENGAVFFKVVNDSRITRVGTFLRNTSLDELPQFFNVLQGKMSIVGNRPLPLYEAAKLTTDDWAERFMAPAGITGLWQIKKREQAYMSMEERIDLDIAYSKNYNFMCDFWIMINTPASLIQKFKS